MIPHIEKDARVAVVVGTYGAVPYVHLQLESWRRLTSDVRLLVHDDCSKYRNELAALCAQYGAEYFSPDTRINDRGAYAGDHNAFLTGLKWADQFHVDILVKLSRRFLPTLPWVVQLRDLAVHSQFPTYSGCIPERNLGFLTSCWAVHVPAWVAAGIPNRLQAYLDGDPVHHPETYSHNMARSVYHSCGENAATHAQRHPKHFNYDAYCDWPLAEKQMQWKPGRLWKDTAKEADYAYVAESWGLSYSILDFDMRRINE